MIQPPGEPRGQHLCEVRPKKFELHTQNFIKDEMTGSAFLKNCKKVKMKSQDQKMLFLVNLSENVQRFVLIWVL